MIDEDQFAQAARDTVGTALAGYGYYLAVQREYRVRFEKPGSFVELTYDASGSHEVSIWVGDSRDSSEPPLELADALRAAGCAAKDVRFAEMIQTSDAEALSRLLARAAELLRDGAGQLVKGESEAFIAAKALRSQRAVQYTSNLTTARILDHADIAWASGDFGRVHDLLSPIRDTLDQSHHRRLEFADKRL